MYDRLDRCHVLIGGEHRAVKHRRSNRVQQEGRWIGIYGIPPKGWERCVTLLREHFGRTIIIESQTAWLKLLRKLSIVLQGCAVSGGVQGNGCVVVRL